MNVGDETHLLCSYEEQIIGCKFIIPGLAYEIQLSSKYSPFTTKSGYKFSYYGKGLERGDCGVTIHSLTVDNEGDAKCILKINHDENAEVLENIKIRIKKPLLLPPKITLLKNNNPLNVGQTIVAECIVEISYKDDFANFSWLLNNEILKNNDRNTSQKMTIRKKSQQSEEEEATNFYEIKSIFNYKLRDDDNGKTLKCKFDSFLMNLTSEAKLPPFAIIQESTMTLLPKIGDAYDIAINFFAFPRPLSPIWRVNEKYIYYGKINDEFISRELKYLGNNEWKAILHIKNITRNNIHFNYTLLVNDANGSKSYNVRLDDLVNQNSYSNNNNYNNSTLGATSRGKLIDFDKEQKPIINSRNTSIVFLNNLKSSTFRRQSREKMSAITINNKDMNSNNDRIKIVQKSRYNTSSTSIAVKTTTNKSIATTVMPTKATLLEYYERINILNKTHDIKPTESEDNGETFITKTKSIDNSEHLNKTFFHNSFDDKFGKIISLERLKTFIITSTFILMFILLLILISMISHYRRQIVILKTEFIQMNLKSCVYQPTYNNYSSAFQRNVALPYDVKELSITAISDCNEEASISHFYQSIDDKNHVYDEISIKTDSLERKGNIAEKDDKKLNNYENNESMNCKIFNNCFFSFIFTHFFAFFVQA